MSATFKLVKLAKKEYLNLDKGNWYELQHELAIRKISLSDLSIEQLTSFFDHDVFPDNENFTFVDFTILAQYIKNWIGGDDTQIFEDDEFFDYCIDYEGAVRPGCYDPDEFIETGCRFTPFLK